MSGLLSTGGALLTGLAYSRDHEREADCYAIALMGQAHLPTAPMADLLLAIAHDEDKKHPGKPSEDKGQSDPPKRSPSIEPGGEGLLSLLNSHPGTVQRATELREGRAPHCAR